MKRAAGRAAAGVGIVGAALGAQVLLNQWLQNRGGPLTSPLRGKHLTYDWRLGKVWYAVAGEGPPVLLIHGFGAGSSSYEWQHNFEPLAEHFQVYALDLLGWGLSQHPPLAHSGRYYVQLIDDFIRYVIQRPANVIASSHSASYATRLAHTRPERIRSLTAICPVALNGLDASPDPFRQVGNIMGTPLFGDSAYHALTSRANIGRTLREDIYYDAGRVNDAMIDHYYAAAHQSGARYGVEAFLKGNLNLDVRQEYAGLKQPVLLVWGAASNYTPLSNARSFQEANDQAILHIFQETRQLPHDEKWGEFNTLIQSWLEPITADQILRILA